MKNFLIAVSIILVLFIGLFYLNKYEGALPANLPSERKIRNLVGDKNLPFTISDEFNIAIFDQGLNKPRVMQFDPNNNLIVSDTNEKTIIALTDNNNDLVSDKTTIIIKDLNQPHGLHIDCQEKQCKLFLAEEHQLSVYDYNPDKLEVTNRQKLLDFPTKDYNEHWSRNIYPGPDNTLLISIGSSCNVCIEQDQFRASIVQVNKDGSNAHVFASGLRNPVYLTQNPTTKEFWTTEMGRDYLGDDLPPDEINIVKPNQFYGWPYCYGNKILDTSFESTPQAQEKCNNSIEPVYNLQAHTAPLGITFIPETWPDNYRNDLLIASHGSWNRSEPTGYKIIRLELEENKVINEVDFISGWLNKNNLTTYGRPAGLLFNQDNLFITDDKAGVIYVVEPKT